MSKHIVQPPVVTQRADRSSMVHRARFLWALSLPAALLAFAVWRVWAPVREAWPVLQHWPWAAAVAVWVLAMAYFEGYRGFQQRVVPTLIERADALAVGTGRGTALMQLPIAAAALWWAPATLVRRRWILLLALTAVIVAVRAVPQPWRGLLDAGVLMGLGWGLVALVVQAVASLGARATSINDTDVGADAPRRA